MACGGSVGEGYGPMVVAPRKLTLDDIKKTPHRRPRHPHHRLSHAQALRPEVETVTVPFDKIIPAVVAGEFDAGLIIHEGQLTYANDGLSKSSTSASGGASRPACRCPSAATPSAARWGPKTC
jgi:1,4-dihydroxy-6-naphthoate synthase